MTHLDLFSGIGGFALASSWVWGSEYRNIGHSEVEPYPCKVYHKHFPESECLGDITKIDWMGGRFKDIDLITGGFPCQPHSVAGKRKASADSRDLWGECKRTVRLVRPKYALFENVPGLLTSERGGFFNRVLSDLAEIGYDAEWYTIGAWQVGAPHKRDRVWIVAYPQVDGLQGRSDGSRGQYQKSSGLLPRGSGESSENVADTINSGLQRRYRSGNVELQAEEEQVRPIGASGIFHPTGEGLPDWSGGEMGQPWPVTELEQPGNETVSDTKGTRQLREKKQKDNGEDIQRGWRFDADNEGKSRKSQREIERIFRRMANGLPYSMDRTLPVTNRVDRLKGLGNAIVPQAAYVVLNAIKRHIDMTTQ